MRQLIKEVSLMLGIDESIVEAVINSYIRSIRKIITKVRYKDLESFDDVKTNINVPGFGRLLISERRKKLFNERKKNEQNKESKS